MQEVVSLNRPGVSNQESSGSGGMAGATKLLDTGACKGVKVRRSLIPEQLVLTPYGSTITSLRDCMFSAHDAKLCDDDGTESPPVDALVL